MNAAHLVLFAGLALASAQGSAHPPAPHGPPGPGSHPTALVPQPIAPSTLPYEAYRYGDDRPYAMDRRRYEDDPRDRCIAQNPSRETTGSGESGQPPAPNAIDWCALAPYEPRYEPQIPASWWWHYGGAPWRRWRPR